MCAPGAAISKSPFLSGSETASPVGAANSDSPDIKKEYFALRKKYIKAYNDLLDSAKTATIDLSKPKITKIIADAFHFWDGKKLENIAFCIMPNHVHWVFQTFEKDEEKKPVYLQDILYSVKRFSAYHINKSENRKGSLWQKESFETTIRNEEHLYFCIDYTLNNPVAAGLVNKRGNWKGSWVQRFPNRFFLCGSESASPVSAANSGSLISGVEISKSPKCGSESASPGKLLPL